MKKNAAKKSEMKKEECCNPLNCIVQCLIGWPERVASHFLWAGPLVARIVAGYVFMLSGWSKLHSLPQITENFINWGIPFPHILTPFVSGVEFFGGICLILGLLTRIAGGMLAGTMVVAIISAKLMDIDSLETLLGFEETNYLAIFFWLAVAGPGKASLDYLITSRISR